MRHNLGLLVVLLLPLSCGIKPGTQLQGGTNNNDGTLFPLAASRQWNYSVTVNGSWMLCKTGTVTQQVVGTSVIEGRLAYELSPLCDSTYTSFWSVVADRIDIRYDNRWVPALDAPAGDNHTWISGSANFIWHSTPTITVKGKTYQNCWTRLQTDTPYSFYETYCPGTGKVLSHFTDVIGNGWDAQLVSKSF